VCVCVLLLLLLLVLVLLLLLLLLLGALGERPKALGAYLKSFGSLRGALGEPLEDPWASLGVPGESLGSLGLLGAPLELPWRSP
jgi:hypothetical protein